jgi:hypothetical protein
MRWVLFVAVVALGLLIGALLPNAFLSPCEQAIANQANVGTAC